jgi:cytidylate kinase
MPNDLLTYFEKRFAEKKPAPKKKSVFVTISRQTGCNATGIAIDLVKVLKAEGLRWNYINKEILENAANKLRLNPSRINYVFEADRKTHVDEVLAAFSSRYYKNDKIVRKTITGVIRHYAEAGNMIIVGRAGVATTRDMSGGLHLRFTAPYEWRFNSLKKRKEFEKYSDKEMEKFIKEHDAKKRKLIESFCGKDMSEIQFDLTINRATFSRQEIVTLITEAMKMKKMI